MPTHAPHFAASCGRSQTLGHMHNFWKQEFSNLLGSRCLILSPFSGNKTTLFFLAPPRCLISREDSGLTHCGAQTTQSIARVSSVHEYVGTALNTRATLSTLSQLFVKLRKTFRCGYLLVVLSPGKPPPQGREAERPFDLYCNKLAHSCPARISCKHRL